MSQYEGPYDITFSADMYTETSHSHTNNVLIGRCTMFNTKNNKTITVYKTEHILNTGTLKYRESLQLNILDCILSFSEISTQVSQKIWYEYID